MSVNELYNLQWMGVRQDKDGNANIHSKVCVVFYKAKDEKTLLKAVWSC